MQFSLNGYLIFSFFSGILGFLVACILYFLNHNQSLAPRLLAFVLLILSSLVIINSLTFTSFFLAFPHVWRVFGWTHFVLPVVAYLYVHTVVYQAFLLRRKEYLLFIPAVIYTLLLIPFYILPTAEKLEIVRRFMEDKTLIALEPETWLLKSWAIPAKLIYGLLLLIGQFWLLVKWRNKEVNRSYLIDQNKSTFRWLFLFTSVMSTFYILLIVEYSFHLSRRYDLALLINFTFSINILFICISLLTRPSILYGFRGWHQESNPIDISTGEDEVISSVPAKKISLTLDQRISYKQQLEKYFDDKQPYRETGYKIKALSDDLGIPSYQLSAFINQEYGKNFNELLNDYRVDYLAKLAITSNDFYQYTLDALSKKAGFNSRNTFITAFKKRTNQTPSDFFKSILAKHNLQ
jgi:AraC-like DNA-binding protein